MLRRRLVSSSFLLQQRASNCSSLRRFSSTGSKADAGNGGQPPTKSLARKAISVVLISLTGGVALSALDDLAIYHACSNKAMEKASENLAIVESLGEPIVKGPWYNASLAVAHRRHSVSCTFPVSGPKGTGIFQLKAVRQGDDTWFSFLRHQEWDILIMEALLHVPANEDKNQTFRISLADSIAPPGFTECEDCRLQVSGSPGKK